MKFTSDRTLLDVSLSSKLPISRILADPSKAKALISSRDLSSQRSIGRTALTYRPEKVDESPPMRLAEQMTQTFLLLHLYDLDVIHGCPCLHSS